MAERLVGGPLPAPGTSGNVLTSDGSWWSSQAAAGGGGTVSAAGWRLKTQNYYSMPNTGTMTATTVGSTQLLLVPFVPLAVDTTFDQIDLNVTTLAASGTPHPVIYELTNGWPAALVLDAGAVSGATTGVKAVTISQTLLASKMYAVGVQGGGASVGLRAYPATQHSPYVPTIDLSSTPEAVGWFLGGQATAPASAAAAAINQSSAMPRIRLRAA